MLLADRWYREFVRRPDLPWGLRAALVYLAVLIRKMTRDAVFVRAGTLSYWSLVALVPALVLTALVLRALGLEAWLDFQTFAGRALATLLPDWNAVGLPAELDARSIGVAGFMVAFGASTRIFLAAEEAYTRIWNSRVRSALTTRLALYYATLTAGPAVIALGLSLTAEAEAVTTPALHVVAPIVVSMAAFSFAIRALPDADVRFRSAVLGGAVSAIAFEVAKAGFTTYIDIFRGEGAATLIYGSLAFVPVLLFFVFVLWVIVLAGVEVASVDQRWPELLRAEERIVEGAEHRKSDGFFALQVMLVIVRRFLAGAGPTSLPQATEALVSDADHVASALRTLEVSGLIDATARGFLPAGPPQELSAAEVVRQYREHTRPFTEPGAAGGALFAAALDAPELAHSLAVLATR
ncbi:MAG: YihY family inner membrane protein [Myxococcales bacterium]|nr:YihY family inner membrane protein [Myxococcales bacterium]